MKARCGDGHCVTCGDDGVAMRIVACGADGIAVCEDADGTRTEVMTALVEPVHEGDTVLVHAGTALVRLVEEAP